MAEREKGPIGMGTLTRTMNVVPPASSITHQHLASAIATEVGSAHRGRAIEILDAGCGGGAMLEYLARALPAIAPECDWLLSGFDVVDEGVQVEGFLSAAQERLALGSGSGVWTDRIRATRSGDAWPFPSGSFDVVVSNQVLEHVRDHDRFIFECARVLKPGGIALHLFPLRSCLWEGHLYLPLAHWIKDHDTLKAYIRTCSKLGLGKFRSHRESTGVSVDSFAEAHADYVHYFTNYPSFRDLAAIAKRNKLRISMRHTCEFYFAKCRQIAGRPARWQYPRRSAFASWFYGRALRHVSSITLVLEKREAYTSSERVP